MQALIEDCKRILENPAPSFKEMAFFLSLFGDGFREESTGILVTFIEIQAHFRGFISHFSQLTFPQEFGFDGFSIEDVLRYLLDPSEFDFSLKKAKGKSLLYGQDHVKIRQSLINKLPREIRFHILTRKITHYKLMSKISAFIKPGELLPVILDIVDIGAGHSVYLVTLEMGDLQPKQIVIKQEALQNQSLFCKLLDSLDWPSFESEHYIDGNDRWEISEYLGNMTLHSFLDSVSTENRTYVELQLAKHAALGDVLGRGDRHFENYMVSAWGIVPIDISFLFWEGNESWNERYLAGGIYEFNLLSTYTHQELQDKFKIFFFHYADTLDFLKQNKAKLEEQISTFCSAKNLVAHEKILFVRQRLEAVSSYLMHQKNSYIQSFFEMKKRLVYKEILIQLVEKNPTILETHSHLKMFYLSDKDRPSCFFLLEDYPQLFHQLEKLACQDLEIQPGYFSSQCSRIETEKQEMLKALE